MSMQAQFLTRPDTILTRVTVPGWFGRQVEKDGIRIADELVYFSEYLRSLQIPGWEWGTITVPADFICDGASVPRFAWALYHPFHSGYRNSAIIHDWLYRQGRGRKLPFSRYVADRIFLEAMEVQQFRVTGRRTMYRAVRLFGPRWSAGKSS